MCVEICLLSAGTYHAGRWRVMCFVCQFVHYQVEVVQPSNDVSMATRKQLSSASDTHGDIAIRMFPPQVIIHTPTIH